MYGDVRSPVLRGLHRGAEFLRRERGDIERAVWRRHSAAGREFDLRSAQHQLLARPHAHFIRAVGERESAEQLAACQRPPSVRGTSNGCRKSPWPLVTVIIAPEG